MTDELKEKLHIGKSRGEEDSDYMDMDSISAYELVRKHRGVLVFLALVCMFGEIVLVGAIRSVSKNGFNFIFKDILMNGATSSVTYILWGITLLIIACMYLIRFKDNPLFDKDRKYTKSKLGTYGTADWMSDAEFNTFLKEENVNKTNETILGSREGKVVTFDSKCNPKDMLNPHLFIIGSSGARKTRTFVLNSIFQSIKREESVILSDVKGELYLKTYELFKAHGYDTKVFNLKEPGRSDYWDFLSEVRKGIDSAQVLCDVIIKNTGGKKGDPFFDKAELNLLKALVLFVASSTYHKERNLNNIKGVYDLLITCNDEEKMSKVLGDFVNANPDHPAYQPYKIYEGAGNVKNNIIVGLGSRMNLFQNKSIAKICSYDAEKNIDLVAPMQKKCAFFVITSDQESSAEVLTSLFFSFLFIDQVDYFDRNSVNPDFHPLKVNFILDEFINLGSLPDIDKKITTVRSRGISMALIAQNIGQLKDKYRDNWETIISNCDTTIVLSVGKTDSVTAKWVSDTLGTQTVEAVSNVQTYNKSSIMKYAGEYKETKGIGKRALLTPDEITSLCRDQEILLISAHHPLILDKFDYTNHPMSKEIKEIKDEAYEEQKLGYTMTDSYMSRLYGTNSSGLRKNNYDTNNVQNAKNKDKNNWKEKQKEKSYDGNSNEDLDEIEKEYCNNSSIKSDVDNERNMNNKNNFIKAEKKNDSKNINNDEILKSLEKNAKLNNENTKSTQTNNSPKEKVVEIAPNLAVVEKTTGENDSNEISTYDYSNQNNNGSIDDGDAVDDMDDSDDDTFSEQVRLEEDCISFDDEDE